MDPTGVQEGNRWSIILAAEEGEPTATNKAMGRGHSLPKPFHVCVGTRSMLQHTWDRADTLTLPDHKVTVVARSHREMLWTQFQHRSAGQVLMQPRLRGTAAGMFLPLAYIRSRNPDATVVWYPSDQFVFPEEKFMAAVRSAVTAAEHLSGRLVLLGVRPTSQELPYGWIQPGREIGRSLGEPVREVKAMVERATLECAKEARTNGALWNTNVLASNVESLWNLGWQCFPELMDLFEILGQTIGTPEEGKMLDTIYEVMPVRDLSFDLLQRCSEHAGVIEARGILWGDWRQADHLVGSLRTLGNTVAGTRCAPVSQ